MQQKKKVRSVPYLPALPAGQRMAIEDAPQHPGSDLGVDPEQAEAVVVVLQFIQYLLPKGLLHCHLCWRAVHGATLFQLLILVL